ncbi:MAG: hypothetical protein ACP5JJ_19945, partial [Anaerolineae bacterium]
VRPVVWEDGGREAPSYPILLLGASWLVTFAGTSYAELLAWLDFPPTEMEALSGIPLQGYEVGLFVALPMLASAAVILASRRHFSRGRAPGPNRETG